MTKFVMYTEYSGMYFNEYLNKSTKLYRFTNDDEIHNDFQYNDGLNVDHLQFNPHGTCQPGGLYFVDDDHMIDYLISPSFTWIREVTIPHDARVYVDNGKYKTDKFVLGERKQRTEYKIEKHKCLEAVKQNGYALQQIDDFDQTQ